MDTINLIKSRLKKELRKKAFYQVLVVILTIFLTATFGLLPRVRDWNTATIFFIILIAEVFGIWRYSRALANLELEIMQEYDLLRTQGG